MNPKILLTPVPSLKKNANFLFGRTYKIFANYDNNITMVLKCLKK